jgi:predicted nucleic acid-binding protein
MPWLIDSDILIEGERGNPAFMTWLQQAGEVATADIIRSEFLFGVHAVADPAKRVRGENFYAGHVARLASRPSDPADYDRAAKLAGEAWRTGQARPSLVDGLLAALALRENAIVATRNLKDFQAMGCPCAIPF